MIAMGFFGRLATLIKSNLNDLISKSEDPEKMLNQVIVDMNQQLVEAKKKHQKKDKRGAIMCMKRKKMYEAQVRARCGSRDSRLEQGILQAYNPMPGRPFQ